MLNFSHHEFYNSNVDLLPIFGGLLGFFKRRRWETIVIVTICFLPETNHIMLGKIHSTDDEK